MEGTLIDYTRTPYQRLAELEQRQRDQAERLDYQDARFEAIEKKFDDVYEAIAAQEYDGTSYPFLSRHAAASRLVALEEKVNHLLGVNGDNVAFLRPGRAWGQAKVSPFMGGSTAEDIHAGHVDSAVSALSTTRDEYDPKLDEINNRIGKLEAALLSVGQFQTVSGKIVPLKDLLEAFRSAVQEHEADIEGLKAQSKIDIENLKVFNERSGAAWRAAHDFDRKLRIRIRELEAHHKTFKEDVETRIGQLYEVGAEVARRVDFAHRRIASVIASISSGEMWQNAEARLKKLAEDYDIVRRAVISLTEKGTIPQTATEVQAGNYHALAGDSESLKMAKNCVTRALEYLHEVAK